MTLSTSSDHRPSGGGSKPSAKSQTIDLSMVIPTYNEAGNLVPLLDMIQTTLAGRHFEIVVVDDNSPDGTWRLAEEYARTHSWVRVIRRQGARGLSTAVLEGFGASRGRFLGVMDADHSHDVQIMPRMLDLLEAGTADVVVGSRRVPGGGADNWPWYRHLTSQVATWMARLLLGVRLKDPMSGYFLLKREVWERGADRLRPTGYKILLELVMAANVTSLVEVPFIFKDRKEGQSKLSSGVIFNYLKQLVHLRRFTKSDKQISLSLALTLSVLSLIPWFLFGLQGPFSDAYKMFITAAAKLGLYRLEWYQLLYSYGIPLLVAPLLFVFPGNSIIWVGSSLLAMTSAFFAIRYAQILTRVYRQAWPAALGALMAACHPLLHQLHFYWMTELVYALSIFFGCYSLACWGSSEKGSAGLWAASGWFTLAVIARPQSSLSLGIGCVYLLWLFWRNRHDATRRWKLAAGCALLLVMPQIVMLPVRLANHRQHGTWALNQVYGENLGTYIERGSAYSKENGPASKQLWLWVTELDNQLRLKPGHPDILNGLPEQSVRYILRARVTVTGGSSVDFQIPKYIAYAFTKDWQAADRFVLPVLKESIKTNPAAYLKWATPQVRWYFTGITENPTEWQDRFYSNNNDRRENPQSIDLTDRRIILKPLGGIAYTHPGFFEAYDRFRSLFGFAMTYIKKLTFVSLPFLLFFVYRRYERWVFDFTALIILNHLATGIIIGLLVGYHHRYNAPFDIFTIFYLCLGLDMILSARRIEKRP